MPIGAIVFFITILAELERIPFDLPEAESEIVAGWLTEFSGMMYGLVQLGSYLKLYAFAALFTILFFTVGESSLRPFLISSSINYLGDMSSKSTFNPMFAKWQAILLPMIPLPNTATFLIILFIYSVTYLQIPLFLFAIKYFKRIKL